MATETIHSQANDTVAPEQPTEKVTFNEAQQARVNELIREAMGRAGREARVELAELKEQLQAVQSGKEPHPAVEEAQHLVKQLRAERDAANSRALQVEKRALLQSAATKVNFIDPNLTTKLTEDQVQYDEHRGRFIVIGSDGNERLNSSLEPMSIEELYSEVAAQHTYLVRGSTKGGSGSSESQRSGLHDDRPEVRQLFGPGSSGKAANDLARRNPGEYRRLREIARREGLIG